MRKIMTAVKWVLSISAILFILLASFLLFLLTTAPGLTLSTQLAKRILPGELVVEKPQGRIIDKFSFSRLSYKEDNLLLELVDFRVNWQWKLLFSKQLVIEAIRARNLTLVLPDNNNSSTTKSPSAQLPFTIIINDAAIEKIHVMQNQKVKEFFNLKLQAHLSPHLWQIARLNVNFAKTEINFTGQAQPIFPYAISARLQFQAKAKQAIQGVLQLGGDFALYHWHGEMLQPKGTTINGSLKNGKDIFCLATWREFIWPIDNNHFVESRNGSLQVNGTIPNVHVSLSAALISPINTDIQLTSDFFGNSLQNVSMNSRLTTHYLGSLLTATAHYHNNQINAQATLGTNQLQIEGSLPYPWHVKALIPNPSLLHPTLKLLQTEFSANATVSSATEGQIDLVMQPGSYQVSAQSSAGTIKFLGGQLHAQLNPKRLQIKGEITLDPNKLLVLNLELPQFRLNQGLSEQQLLTGKINLHVNSLAFLENFSTVPTKIEGQLTALLTISGQAKQPILAGSLNIDKAKLLIPQLGIHLDPMQMNLQSRNQHWTSQGSVVSQGRSLTLTGKGDFTPELSGSLALNSTDFPLIKTDEYSINLSPQLVINFKPNAIDMTGQILIPTAQIKPQNFTNTTSLSSDAVFVGNQDNSSTNPLAINTDIRVEMGEQVAVDVKGLRGFLNGNIRLRQLPQGPLNASGELTIRDGKYQAYGQDLAIDQGQLLFTGGSIANPGINLRAIRRFDNSLSYAGSNHLFDFNSANLQKLDFGNEITVGVEVTGRLTSPKIKLFSEPSTLNQADILSMLLLGKPASQANQAGAQLLLKAISSMNLGGGSNGTQLLSQLKQTLGVDLNIKSNTQYNQQTNKITESNSVVVGKSVTKRIYVSYNLGLAQADSNVFTLTYLLNKFFSIQVNASVTASGVDLLYTHQKE